MKIQKLQLPIDSFQRKTYLDLWLTVSGMNSAEQQEIILIDIVELIEVNEDFTVTVRFVNEEIDEVRRIDFRRVLDLEEMEEEDVAFPIVNDIEVFRTVELVDENLQWPGVGIMIRLLDGARVFAPFEMDPGILYQLSDPVEKDLTDLSEEASD